MWEDKGFNWRFMEGYDATLPYTNRIAKGCGTDSYWLCKERGLHVQENWCIHLIPYDQRYDSITVCGAKYCSKLQRSDKTHVPAITLQNIVFDYFHQYKIKWWLLDLSSDILAVKVV